jgi:DNA polymerase (family 10)
VRLKWWPTTSDSIAAASGLVASVHSRFRLDAEAQTARIVRAVSNPYTTILGHLTGRLLLRREGYGVDIDEVLRT